MITPAQRAHIAAHAYVPEHLPDYVTPIAQTEPVLVDEFVAHVGKGRLILIGYPLRGEFVEEALTRALDVAMARFKPRAVTVTSPRAPVALREWTHAPPDQYYRLDLAARRVPQKVRNMLTRAARELTIETTRRFDRAHRQLVDDFQHTHALDDATRAIFGRIGAYVAHAPTARVFEARNARGHLVAFDVAEFGARAYAFYLFNFTARQHAVPGASDLVLAKIVEHARREGKQYVNLGLGINAGVTFFKTKWGGEPFLPHTFCVKPPSSAQRIEELFSQFG